MFLEADREITCCFSGHRPNKLPWRDDETDPRCIALKTKLADIAEALYDAGMRHYICGMAQGCDMYFCETVLALRRSHPEIHLEAAVPFPGQPNRWPEPLCARYRSLLEQCDEVSVLQHTHTPDCMMRRNKYMVDASSLLLCCFAGTPGGTMNTVLYAERSGLEVRIIEL